MLLLSVLPIRNNFYQKIITNLYEIIPIYKYIMFTYRIVRALKIDPNTINDKCVTLMVKFQNISKDN